MVKYSYLADGTKISALRGSGERLVYRGPFVYRQSADSSLTLESASFSGGLLTPGNVLLYVRDYLGSVRAVVDAETGALYKAVDYSAFGNESGVTGMQLASLPSGMTLRDGYTGKEDQSLDFGAAYIDFGARQYSPALNRWLVPDPLSEKFYGISPYAFCNSNPVNYVDVDGRKVFPKGMNALSMIQNTVPLNLRKYVQVDRDGFINDNLLKSVNTGISYNFDSLLELANSSIVIEVELNDGFLFRDSEGNVGKSSMSYIPYDSIYPEDKDVEVKNVSGLSTGEMGFYGKTLFPDNMGQQNSINDNIMIVVNSSLSALGAAETFSHEGYGHALLYIRNGGDHDGASHMPVSSENGHVETNSILKAMILTSRKETIKNFNIH